MAGFVKGTPIRHYDQTLFLNDKNVPGVQSVQTSFDVPLASLNHLGANRSIYTKSGPRTSSVSVNTLFFGQDQFLQYTGNQSFNLYLLDQENEWGDNYMLNDCYLTSYRHSYDLNKYPTIDISATSFGKAGKIAFLDFGASNLLDLININTTEPTGIFNSIHAGCLEELTFLGDSKLLAYDISISTSRIPRYYIGKRNPTVNLSYPINISVNLSFEASQYSYKQLDSYPANENRQNINITLKNELGSTIKSYSFDDMIFSSQSYALTANENVRVNLAYKKEIFS